MDKNLTDLLSAGPPVDPRRRCGVKDWVDMHSLETQKKINAALDPKSDWSSSQLLEVFLKDEEVPFTLGSDRIRTHRRKDCACGRIR